MLARAAIEAMREPTLEMMNALDDGDEDRGLEHGWRMAIDAALSRATNLAARGPA